MALVNVLFDTKGKPLIAEVASLHAQPGSYTLMLWDAGGKKILLDVKGEFTDTNNKHKLPEPVSVNNGRVVESTFTLNIMPPVKKYKVVLSIYQNEKIIGCTTCEGETDSAFKEDDILLKLVAKD